MLSSGAAVDYKDGFVGCMRALMVNGKVMDMRGMVERGEVTYGVSTGRGLSQWKGWLSICTVYEKHDRVLSDKSIKNRLIKPEYDMCHEKIQDIAD